MITELPPCSSQSVEASLLTFIIELLSQATGIQASAFSRSTGLASLGLDSVEREQFVAAVERRLERHIDTQRVSRANTLGELLDVLSNQPPQVRPEAMHAAEPNAAHPFARFVNPPLADKLRILRLDKRFQRGSGSFLYDDAGREYLDFIAAYGSLPFGHTPPAIWEAALAIYRNSEPIFIQPSALDAAGDLARELLRVAPRGLARVTFGNSGAEAAEAAIKLARAATGRLGIVSTTNGFHGKTLGALSATAKRSYQEGFGAPLPDFYHVPFGDLEALRVLLQRSAQTIAAFIVEPIQGEGGMNEAPPGYLASAQRLCREANVLFIVDEIQTGLGRSGVLFACESEGLEPDVLLLAKALGGGVCPISAVLCTEAAYSERFALKHSSTFAGNTLSCRVGLATLRELEKDQRALVRSVAELGTYLREGLVQIQNRYPGVIEEVRGRGFMLGLKLSAPPRTLPDSFLDVAAHQGHYAALVAAYLLNAEGLRVAPTLNGSDVLRIEPPLNTSRQECDRALKSLDRAFELLAEANTGSVLAGVQRARPSEPPSTGPKSSKTTSLPVVPHGASRFAFLIHPLEDEQLLDFDPSLAELTTDEIHSLATEMGDLFDPFVAETVCVESKTGQKAYGDFIVVPRTAAGLIQRADSVAPEEVRAAVDLAHERGATLVGLGGYTSIVTRSGLAISDCNLALTTGNAFTAASGVEALRIALRSRGRRLSQCAAVVMGATGAVGRSSALLLSREVARLLLVGNPRRPESIVMDRLRAIARSICRHAAVADTDHGTYAEGSLLAWLRSQPLPSADAPDEAFAPILTALERAGRLMLTRFAEGALTFGDAVIVATSSTEKIVAARALKRSAVVCDLSRPANVSEAILTQRPDVMVIDGGLIEVPFELDLRRFGLARRHAYACMAEAMLLALERQTRHFALGPDFGPEAVLHVQRLAARHGFKVARLRSFGRILDVPTHDSTPMAAPSALFGMSPSDV